MWAVTLDKLFVKTTYSKRYMNKVLLTVFCFCVFLSIRAQNQQARVVLKNGTEIIGSVISIDPSVSLKMNIAGVESVINMEDVAKIETINPDPNSYSDSNNNSVVSSEYAKVCELTKDSKIETAFSKHLTLVYGDLNHFTIKRKSFSVNLELPLLKIEGEPIERYAMSRESGWLNVFKKEIDVALEAFIEKWNSNMRGILAKKNNTDMTMNLFITEMDLGSNAAGFWGMQTIDGGATMSGYLELVDNKSNEVLSIVRINGIRGLGNNGFTYYKEGNRVKKVFEKLAIKMADDVGKDTY